MKPGHVLLCPVKTIGKYCELNETEVIDLWISAKKIGENLKRYYNCDSIQYNIQDGPEAGQIINHLHMHIIPEFNESTKKENLDLDEVPNRTMEEITKEAEMYREHFNLK